MENEVSYLLLGELTNFDFSKGNVISSLLKLENYISVFKSELKTGIVYAISKLDVAYISFLRKLFSKGFGELSIILGELLNDGILVDCHDENKIKPFRAFLTDRAAFDHRGLGDKQIGWIRFYELSPTALQIYRPLESEIEKRVNPLIVSQIKDYQKAWTKTHREIEEQRITAEKKAEMDRFENLRNYLIREMLLKKMSFSAFSDFISKYQEKTTAWTRNRLDLFMRNIEKWKDTNGMGWDHERLMKIWGKRVGLESEP